MWFLQYTVCDNHKTQSPLCVDSVGIMEGKMRMFCISPHSLAIPL